SHPGSCPGPRGRAQGVCPLPVQQPRRCFTALYTALHKCDVHGEREEVMFQQRFDLSTGSTDMLTAWTR
ncbi:hypothetical protein LEMLEM_LOCUS20364, partial [Lemmus lemmus]